MVEERHLALKPLLPHADERRSALQHNEEADPKERGGVAFGEGADADGLGIRKANVNPYAEKAGQGAAPSCYARCGVRQGGAVSLLT